ncbi:hypothetical protein N2152v2_008841 [Parachlorella kessleri]
MDNQSLRYTQLYLAAGAVPTMISAGLVPAAGTLLLPTSQHLQASLRALMEEDPVRLEPSQSVPVAYCMAMTPAAACGPMPTTTMPQLSADAVRIANAFHRQHQQLQPPQHEQHAHVQAQPHPADQPGAGPAGMQCSGWGSHGCMPAAQGPAEWAPTQLGAYPQPNITPAWVAQQGQGSGGDGAGLLASWQVHARDDAPALQLPSLTLHSAEVEGDPMSPIAALEALLSSPAFRDAPRVPISGVAGNCSPPHLSCQPSSVPVPFPHASSAHTPLFSQAMRTGAPAADGGLPVQGAHAAGNQQCTDLGAVDTWALQGQRQQPLGPSMVPTPQLPPPWYPSLQQGQEQQQAKQQPAGSLAGLGDRSMVHARSAAAQLKATAAPLTMPQAAVKPPCPGEELRHTRSLPVPTTTATAAPMPPKKSGRSKRPKSRTWGSRKRRGPANKATQKAGEAGASSSAANPSSATGAGASLYEGEPLQVTASHATPESDCPTTALTASQDTAPAGGSCSHPFTASTHQAAYGLGIPARRPAGQEGGVPAASADSKGEGEAEEGGLPGFPFMTGSLGEQAGSSLAGMLSPLQEALLQLPGPKGTPQALKGFGFLSPPAASLLPLFSPTFCYGSLASPFSSFRPQELPPLGLFGQQGSQAAPEQMRQQQQQQQQHAGTQQQEEEVQAQLQGSELQQQDEKEGKVEEVEHQEGPQHQQHEERKEGGQRQHGSAAQGETEGEVKARSGEAADQGMQAPAPAQPQQAHEQSQLEIRDNAAAAPASPAATLAPLLSPRSLVHAFEAVRKGSPLAALGPCPATAAAGFSSPGAELQQGSENTEQHQPASRPGSCTAANVAKGSAQGGIRAVAATCPFDCPAVHVSSEHAVCEVPTADTSGAAAAAHGGGAKGGRKRPAVSRRARKKAPAGAAPTQESPVPLGRLAESPVEGEDYDAPAVKRQRKAEAAEVAEEAPAARQASAMAQPKAQAPVPVRKQATQTQELQASAQRSAPQRSHSTARQQKKRVSKLQPQRSMAQRRRDFAALLADEDQERDRLPSRPPGAWPVPAGAANRKKAPPLPELAVPSSGQQQQHEQAPRPEAAQQQQQQPAPMPAPQHQLQAVADSALQAQQHASSVSPAATADVASPAAITASEPQPHVATGPEPGADLLMALSSPQPPPLAALSMELQAVRAAARRSDAAAAVANGNAAAGEGKGKAARAAGKRGSTQPGLQDEAGGAASASLAAGTPTPAKPRRSKKVATPATKAAGATAAAADPPSPPSKRQRRSPPQLDPAPAGPGRSLTVGNKPAPCSRAEDRAWTAAATAAGGSGAAQGETKQPAADTAARSQAKQRKSATVAGAGPGEASWAQPRRSGPSCHTAPDGAVAAAAAGSSADVAEPAATAQASEPEAEQQLPEGKSQATAAGAMQQVLLASGRRAAAVAAAAAIAADAAQGGDGAVPGSGKGRKRKAPDSTSSQAQGSTPEGGTSGQPAGGVPSAGRCPPKFSAPRKRVVGQLTRMERSVCQIIAHVGTRTDVFESEIRRAFGNNPDISKALRLLREDERLVRQGEGGRGTPFSYTATDKGRAEILACRQKLEADAAAMSRLFAKHSPPPPPAAEGPPVELQASPPGQGEQECQRNLQAQPSAAATRGDGNSAVSRQPATREGVYWEEQQQQQQPKKQQRAKLGSKVAGSSPEGKDEAAGTTLDADTGSAPGPLGEPVTKDDHQGNGSSGNGACLAAERGTEGSPHSDTPAPRRAPDRRKPVKKGGRGVGRPRDDFALAAGGRSVDELPSGWSPPEVIARNWEAVAPGSCS